MTALAIGAALLTPLLLALILLAVVLLLRTARDCTLTLELLYREVKSMTREDLGYILDGVGRVEAAITRRTTEPPHN